MVVEQGISTMILLYPVQVGLVYCLCFEDHDLYFSVESLPRAVGTQLSSKQGDGESVAGFEDRYLHCFLLSGGKRHVVNSIR